MAQLEGDEGARISMPYRARPSQASEVAVVLQEEVRGWKGEPSPLKGKKRREPTTSQVCELLVAYGLDLYWALHELDAELREVAESRAWSRREAVLHVMRAGLGALRGAKK